MGAVRGGCVLGLGSRTLVSTVPTTPSLREVSHGIPVLAANGLGGTSLPHSTRSQSGIAACRDAAPPWGAALRTCWRKGGALYVPLIFKGPRCPARRQCRHGRPPATPTATQTPSVTQTPVIGPEDEWLLGQWEYSSLPRPLGLPAYSSCEVMVRLPDSRIAITEGPYSTSYYARPFEGKIQACRETLSSSSIGSLASLRPTRGRSCGGWLIQSIKMYPRRMRSCGSAQTSEGISYSFALIMTRLNTKEVHGSSPPLTRSFSVAIGRH